MLSYCFWKSETAADFEAFSEDGAGLGGGLGEILQRAQFGDSEHRREHDKVDGREPSSTQGKTQHFNQRVTH